MHMQSASGTARFRTHAQTSPSLPWKKIVLPLHITHYSLRVFDLVGANLQRTKWCVFLSLLKDNTAPIVSFNICPAPHKTTHSSKGSQCNLRFSVSIFVSRWIAMASILHPLNSMLLKLFKKKHRKLKEEAWIQPNEDPSEPSQDDSLEISIC